jgi:UDP-2-acetamido-2,6-beta-L-arabino-hexul-4-ose reductase
MRIVVTGARGLLGWHSAARLHAQNCAARYRGAPEPFELVNLDHAQFNDDGALAQAVTGADAVLHWAGVNRGPDADVEAANPAIARRLATACAETGTTPHIVYANSTHGRTDSPYGRSKRIAGEVLQSFAQERFTDLVLPHIFGECARPDYNNVTATLIDRIWNGVEPEINPQGRVSLLHAGEAAQLAIDAALQGRGGAIVPQGRDIGVVQLYERLMRFHALYEANTFPELTDPFDLALFNSYRTGGYPNHYPRPIEVKSDPRGVLFESAKGGNSSHTFLSTTRPGQSRGDHFHYDLVERFLVVKGEAILRIRKVLTDEVREFRVSGDKPVAVDQLPFHTHNIVNEGDEEVITFFWSHRMFDPDNPDTYADPV